MSRENVEVVRENFEQLNRRDWAAVKAAYDEDVVLVADGSVGPNAGVVSGREAVGRWFGDWFRAFGKDYRFEVEEARSIGDRVLLVVQHRARGRASGAHTEWITANIFSVRGGKIVRVEVYGSRVEALKAVGLAE
jgi:ketosteroid isomerase-like protein